MPRINSISAAILLLISFWFSDLLPAQYFPDDLDMPALERQGFVSKYSNLLKSMKEPTLWSMAQGRNVASYRFTYEPGRGGGQPTVLRLDKIAPTEWLLTVKHGYSNSDRRFKVNRSKRLTQSEVTQFQEFFTQLDFWHVPAVGAFEAEFFIADGPIWVLEAVENERYRVVRRRSPTDKFWEDSALWPQWAVEKYGKFKEDYPVLDRATNEEMNKKLVALGEYLVKLSGLKLEVY